MPGARAGGTWPNSRLPTTDRSSRTTTENRSAECRSGTTRRATGCHGCRDPERDGTVRFGTTTRSLLIMSFCEARKSLCFCTSSPQVKRYAFSRCSLCRLRRHFQRTTSAPVIAGMAVGVGMIASHEPGRMDMIQLKSAPEVAAQCMKVNVAALNNRRCHRAAAQRHGHHGRRR